MSWLHFQKELLELGWVSQLVWALAQGPILYPHSHMAQDRVCLLGLLPVTGGHAGDLWTIPHWAQDMWAAAVCLSRTCGALKDSLSHYNIIENYNWQTWPLSNDSQDPALL